MNKSLLLAAVLLCARAAPSSLPTVVIFRANDTLKTCYRNPVLLRAPNGDLLCFIEERFRGADWSPSHTSGDHSCPDNYDTAKHPGGTGGHNLGFSRSTDEGRSWGPIVRLAGNISNLAAGDADYTNNAPVLAALPNGTRRIVWQYGTQNNPSLPQHGRLLQRHSDDSGVTWSWPPRDVSAAAAAVGLPGATPGPGTGVQVAGSGRLVYCAWGNTAATPYGSPGWGQAANFANVLLYSDDYGGSWSATAPIGGRGWNECFVQQLNGTTLLEVARRTNPDSSVAPAAAYPAHTYATTYWDVSSTRLGKLKLSGKTEPPRPRSAVGTLGAPGEVMTPVCEASLLSVEGNGNDNDNGDSGGGGGGNGRGAGAGARAGEGTRVLYLSHPQSVSARTNLTIQRSTDGGRTWPSSVLVSGADSGSGYSALVELAGRQRLGIAFNQWPTQQPKDSDDGPGAFIRFATVPLAAF